jgi:hypothetical protein
MVRARTIGAPLPAQPGITASHGDGPDHGDTARAQTAHLFRSGGTNLTYVSLAFVDPTPHQLRLHAEHCRHLADSQVDERVRTILQTMALEFDQQAVDLDCAQEQVSPPSLEGD